MQNKTANSLKVLIKRIHGALIQLLLPVLVYPPGVMYKGAFYTIPRASIMRFLESWQARIHGRVLDVGVGTWAYPRRLFSQSCQYTATDCFEDSNIDIVSDIHALSDVFPADQFDFVICTDVFEHTQRPWVAVRQLYHVLKPGGILLLTTPFNFHLHSNEFLKDYWRLSADGLRQLLVEEAGFKDIEITPIGHPEFPFSHTVVAHK